MALACSSGQPSLNSNSWKRHYKYAQIQLDSNRTELALKHFERAYSILNASNSSSNNLCEIAESLAKTYVKTKERKNAAKYFERAIECFSYNQLNSDEHYSNLLYSQGLNYRSMGDYENANQTFKKRLRVLENSVGKENDDYTKTLNALSISLRRDGRLSEAIEYNKKAIDIVKTIYGESSTEYLKKLNSLSIIYWRLGRYKEGFDIQNNLLEHYPAHVRDTSFNYASALFTMSLLYNGTNQYQEEIKMLNQFKDILSKNPNYHKYLINANNNLAVAYDNLGNYEKSIQIITEVLKNTSPEEIEYPKRLQNLAYYQTEMGDYENALLNYNKAIKAYDNLNKSQSSDFAQLIDAKGQMHLKKGEFVEAEQLFLKALDLMDQLDDINQSHSEYGFFLNNYARSLLALERYADAINTLKKGIKLSEDNSVPDPIRYYRKQQDLAEAYLKTGKYSDALQLLNKFENDIANRLGKDHQDYGTYLKQLGKAQLLNSNPRKALEYLKEHNTITIKQIDKIFKFRTEKENKEFIKTLKPDFDELQALALNNSALSDELIEINLNNQLLLKNLLLSQSKQIIDELLKTSDAAIISKVLAYKQLRSEVSGMINSGTANISRQLDSLNEELNKREAELTAIYSKVNSNNSTLENDWKSLKNLLKPEDIAIEFSSFKSSNKEDRGDTYYVAYLYKKDWERPKMISLFKEQELLATIKNKSPNELYKTRGSKGRRITDFENIFTLVWKPLESELDDVNTIYFSPSGILNQIPFAALSTDEGNRLIDQYKLIRLSNTGKLKERENFNLPNNIYVYGGIDYNYVAADKEQEVSQSNITNLESFKASKSSNKKGDFWEFLPGSLTEVSDLAKDFDKKGIKYKKVVGEEATESDFKSLDGDSPKVIHIATHGFFYENFEKGNNNTFNGAELNPYTYSEDPLLRSGLIFAGGNYAWKNGFNPYAKEDGILTALEISNLDLSNTDLMVLSACETGLGDIDGSEGVYGLQRAFKMAGVDLIIMSLWEVPDTETSEFMALFYQFWADGMEVRTAFRKTQQTMARRYAKHPEKWAAFVLFE